MSCSFMPIVLLAIARFASAETPADRLTTGLGVSLATAGQFLAAHPQIIALTLPLAVVFAILLVTANAMMMSARERTGEVAVLKTIGFPDGTLFRLVMVEAGSIALTGALIGLGGAKLLYKLSNFNAGGFLPGFDVTPRTLLIGTVIALLLMLASGLVPALRAARLPVVQALRRVE